jgi:hypothetical protein
MPHYKCEYCTYSTKNNQHFTKHKKTNKHRNKLIELGIEATQQGVMNQNEPGMNQNEPAMNQNEPAKSTKMNQNEPAMNQKIFKCQFCESFFNSRASCRRHEIHRCMENPDFVDKIIHAKNSKIQNLQKDKEALQKNTEKLEKEKQELYKQVAILLDKVGDTTNIQNNIILNNYGKEDMSHITDAVKTSLLNMPYGAIPKMIEAIHFNDDKPENKNIIMPNKKENFVKIFQGDKWIYKNKNDTINDLVDSKYNILDDHFDEMESTDHLAPQIKTTFTKFRKFYEEGDAEMVDKLKKECELVLLNNR